MPPKTLLSIIFAFAILGAVSFLFPVDGINIGFTTLRFPSLAEMFPAEEENSADETPKEDPEEAVRRMLEETRKREFAAYADSLAYYENFFKNGATRFELPGDDPTWFDKFFLSLEIASLGEGVVHVVHYGDSQLEEDRISSTIREDLQTLFGGAGPGLVPAMSTVPAMTITHSGNGDMERKVVFGDSTLWASHNRYGMLAQMAELNGAANITIRKRKDRKDDFKHIEGFKTVKLLAGKESAKFAASLSYEAQVEDDSGHVSIKKMQADAPTIDRKEKLTVYTWNLPYKANGATLSVRGRADLYALSADGEYGVAVDNVAMRGSSGTVFHRIDKTLLKESFEAMNVQLLILEYGGNMVPGMSAQTESWTYKVITRQIDILQEIYPEADIVFIGPADMCKQADGKLKDYPGLERTIKVLKEIAAEKGLAYWDMFQVMGGKESMIKWVKQTPALGSADYIHFTRAGAAHMGDLFSSSLRMYYDYFKFREAHKLDSKKVREIKEYKETEKNTGDSATTAESK